ncbi:hypothetical protein BDR07DRAFT_1424322 [Suillus spraguei]|nr:hypothetical protein BDR07DRAFT_1424322 [Suillus spraguei]
MVQLYFEFHPLWTKQVFSSFAITFVTIGILHHTTASATWSLTPASTTDATETRVQGCLGMPSTMESIVSMPGLPRNQVLHDLFLGIHDYSHFYALFPS